MSLSDFSKRLLARVPKSAIVHFLVDESSEEEMNAALTSIFPGGKAESSETHFSSLSRDQLIIEVFEALPSSTDADIQRLYELNRYRGMKSLYLYALPTASPITIDDSNIAELEDDQ